MGVDNYPAEVTDKVVMQSPGCNKDAWKEACSCLVNNTAMIASQHHNNRGIDDHYYLAICLFVWSTGLGWGADGHWKVGWPEKSSYTVHFPSVLISMSTVKAPPMRRSGGNKRRGKEQGAEPVKEAFLCHQAATKAWPLHQSRREVCIYRRQAFGNGGLSCCCWCQT